MDRGRERRECFEAWKWIFRIFLPRISQIRNDNRDRIVSYFSYLFAVIEKN